MKRITAAIQLKTRWSPVVALLFANKHLDAARLMVADGAHETVEAALLELAGRADA